MRKALALLLSLVLVFGLCACGGGNGDASTPPADNSQAPATKAPEGNNDPAPAGKVSLDVIISQYGNYTQERWIKFKQDFEAANDNVVLNIESVSWNDRSSPASRASSSPTSSISAALPTMWRTIC